MEHKSHDVALRAAKRRRIASDVIPDRHDIFRPKYFTEWAEETLNLPISMRDFHSDMGLPNHHRLNALMNQFVHSTMDFEHFLFFS